jgi:hypothetical protein
LEVAQRGAAGVACRHCGIGSGRQSEAKAGDLWATPHLSHSCGLRENLTGRENDRVCALRGDRRRNNN